MCTWVELFITEYIVTHTTPVKVTRDGSFLSNNVTSEGDEDLIHYKIALDDRYHLLEMRRNWNFMSPSMILERRRSNTNEIKTLKELQSKCFFQGKIKGKEDTFVALAACNGLVIYYVILKVKPKIIKYSHHQSYQKEIS